MATSNIAPTIRRAEPLVKNCFRNAFFHHPTSSEAAAALSSSPQLVVLFPWVGAKERYAHKFVESWSRRGFSVLHVTTPVMDLVKPKTGTEVTACRVIEFLSQNDNFKVILHGLSVGGYLGQRILMGLQGSSQILNRVTHQIYDSFTHVDGFHSGVENAVKPRYRSFVRTATRLYSRYADFSPFEAATNFIYEVPTPAPALFLHSLADKVGRYDSVDRMLPYMARGSPVYTLLIPEEEKMAHVSLFRHMGEEAYMSSIMRFMKSNNFTPREERILDEEDPSSESALINISRMKPVQPLSC